MSAFGLQQELMRQHANDIATSGMDPFLGLADHSRQESNDSGLGLGPLPHTPDFTYSMEDNMDGVSGMLKRNLKAVF